MSEIREAVPSDLVELIELVRRSAIEVHGSLGFDPEIAAETLAVAMNRAQSLLLVADSGSRLTGYLYAAVERSWFGRDLIATDLMVYTLPSARGPGDGYRMHKRFVQWAKAQGAKLISSANISDMPEERWLSVMRRLGYERRGAIAQQHGG